MSQCSGRLRRAQPLIPLPRPSPRSDVEKGQAAALPVPFAPLAGRRCRQADEGPSRGAIT
ncbi:hypothetical protein CN135_14290 [Sinorhizobium meliloti]|nr:hypothetical protein DA101_011260 [Sinorhizobium meliloti]RVG11862.1 hypothetical protein CN230_14790 [Sinorhizobium meliloti]RVG33082.1 hypothetical protein CN229_07135 [Sinorhizobium meliloti]RVG35846.1 hypothetical protein CN225_12510 [Sinorhizobium meliloti]RVG64564.1 hypothetical protein CN224_04425 [Sinorhizobium meliloti]